VRFDAVLFDLDGTLADTAPDLGGALNRVREQDGLAPLPIEQLRPWASNGVRGLLHVGYGMTPQDERYPAYQARFLEIYPAMLCVDTALFPEVTELLAALEAAGTPWGIVTNKAERFTLPLLRELDLDRRAACIVSGDTAPRPKPAPDPLLLAARLVDANPARCAYVGDDLRDIQAARAAGMTSIAAAYGYLGASAPVHEWGADHTIAAPLELLALLG
jgi:phosphoglycolate phosphatase